jgi:hypothetical protein
MTTPVGFSFNVHDIKRGRRSFFIPDTVVNLSKCFELPINQSIIKIRYCNHHLL